MSIGRFLPQTIVILILLAGSACAQSNGGAITTQSDNVVIIEAENGKHRFTVEVADEEEEYQMGLMFRTELAADAGMLFNFKESRPIGMWMKNTLIPLDMAFIDEEGVIIRIAENTAPRSLEMIPSGGPVVAVLEVNGGAFAQLGIKEGDRVRHPIFGKH